MTTHAKAGSMFFLSAPTTMAGLTVFPLRAEAPAAVPPVLLLSEALAQEKVVVQETGHVGQLRMDNVGDLPVIGLVGDLVKGGRQDRALRHDLVVLPGQRDVDVGSFCVERERWGHRGAERVDRFTSSERSAPSRIKRSMVRGTSQHEVWEEVTFVQRRIGSRLGRSVQDPTSVTSLQLTLEDREVSDYAEAMQQELRAVAEQEGTVGYVAAMGGRLVQAEGFATPELFQRQWPKILQGLAVEVLGCTARERAASPPDGDAAGAWLRRLDLLPEIQRLPAGAAAGVVRGDQHTTLRETRWPAQNVLHWVAVAGE